MVLGSFLVPIFLFDFIPDTGLQNPCKFLSGKSPRSIFCSNEMTQWEPPWLLDGGSSPQKNKTMIRSLQLSDLPSFSREGRRSRNRADNWSCLCEEASIKSQQYGVWKASRLATHSQQESYAPQIHTDRSSCTWDFEGLISKICKEFIKLNS